MLGFVNTPGLRISNDSSSELGEYQDILIDCKDGSQIKTISSALLISNSGSTKTIKRSDADIVESISEPTTEDSRSAFWIKIPSA